MARIPEDESERLKKQSDEIFERLHQSSQLPHNARDTGRTSRATAMTPGLGAQTTLLPHRRRARL